MAHVEKYTDEEVSPILRHNSRKIKNNSNKDIDPKLTHLNYSLAPRRRMDPYVYYKRRKAQLYCYDRKDVKTMAGFIITLPKEITIPEKKNEFFRAVYDFLEERYGRENVIQAQVHYDEGKREKVKNPRTGRDEINSDGTFKTRLVFGQPHLHFNWIPVVKVDPEKANRRGSISGKKFSYHEEMSRYKEKICAKELLTKTELRRFHTDLDKYLKERGIEGNVMNGSTQGKGYTVEQLKKKTEMEMKIKELEHQVEAKREWTVTW